MSKRPFILLSNDDGIRARGLRVLVSTLRRFADVVVVAPETEQSAASHSLTLHRPLRIIPMGRDQYAVNGTPTDCITLAVHQILKRSPDLLVAGINRGPNLGDDIHYSGTVSAAVEGTLLGLCSVAVSLAVINSGRAYYQSAADFTVSLCQRVIAEKMPKGVLLNVNVPNLPDSALRGWTATTLGKRNYGGIIVEKTDPRGRPYFWIGGDQQAFFDRKGTDCSAIQDNKVSVTPLKIDFSHRRFLRTMKTWKIS